MDKEQETKEFVKKLVSGYKSIGVDPRVALTVMLFETGGTLSAKYASSTSPGVRFPAVSLLQWTIAGTETVRDLVGIPLKPTQNDSAADPLNQQAYNKIKLLSRLKQLDLVISYHQRYYAISPKVAQLKASDPDLLHYSLTLNPYGSVDLKDGNGVSARQLTSGQGAAGKNYSNYKKIAEQMLNGKVGFPNEIEGDGFVTQRTYKSNGTTIVSPEESGSATYSSNLGKEDPKSTESKPSATSSDNKEKKKKTIDDLLPVKLKMTIPLYPRLNNLKPADVLILPPTSQLRDWVVTNIEINLRQGLSEITISAARPLDPAPFVQAELLSPQKGTEKPLSYYWLRPQT